MHAKGIITALFLAAGIITPIAVITVTRSDDQKVGKYIEAHRCSRIEGPTKYDDFYNCDGRELAKSDILKIMATQ